MARMRRARWASAVRAASARNCEILKSWCVISIADMLPAPRINDMLHRVTVAVVWESPQESGSQAAGIIRTIRSAAFGCELVFLLVGGLLRFLFSRRRIAFEPVRACKHHGLHTHPLERVPYPRRFRAIAYHGARLVGRCRRWMCRRAPPM